MEIYKSSFTKAYKIFFYVLMIPIPTAYLLSYLMGSKSPASTWIEYLMWYFAALAVATYCAFYRKYKYQEILIEQKSINISMRSKKMIILFISDIDEIRNRMTYLTIKTKKGKKIDIETSTMINSADASKKLDESLEEWYRKNKLQD